jgi:hypothetical protein
MRQILGKDKKMTLLSFVAAGATVIAGLIHLSLVNPLRGPLQDFGIFFLVSGTAQIFWIIPTIRNWHRIWYYTGITGTGVLILIWVLSRFSSFIFQRPFPVN